jgi:hypothetical protein
MSLIWSSPHADVRVYPTIEPEDQYRANNILKYGELDPLIRSHKMVTLLIVPKTIEKELTFHTDDDFGDENIKTIIHFIDGYFHHGLGDSADSKMIKLAFQRSAHRFQGRPSLGREYPAAYWDEFLAGVLTSVYGSIRESIDMIADSLE